MATAKTASKPQQPLSPIARAAAHQFRGLRDWIEVFRAGTHTDSKGRTASFSAADLDEMAANVVGSGVPHVLGHPKHDDPAWAWTKPGDLRRDGDSLLARASDIDSQFEAAVDAGRWRERSVSIYKDKARGWVVRHIGWLGAMEPGVIGQQPLQYAADLPEGAELYEFAAEAPAWDTGYALSQIGTMFRALREWLIAKDGLDVADRLVPDWALSTLADTARRITEITTEPEPGMFNRGNPMPKTYTEEEFEAARTAAAAEAAAAAQLQFAAQGAELSELRAARQAERITTRINGWKAAGQLLPAEEPGLAEFMAALEGDVEGGEFTFSAPDKTEVKKTPAQYFADFMGARKPLVRLGSGIASGATAMGGDPGPVVDTQDYQAISRAAAEYVTAQAKAGREVTVAQAVTHVMQGRAA